MQTFLPYKDFEKTAEVLDYQRLGKQRVETLQILKVNHRIETNRPDHKIPWENHPAVLMWRNYSNALYVYLQVICKEWERRGYKDTCLNAAGPFVIFQKIVKYPPWLGNEEFHISHQSNLLRKKEDHYGQYFNGVPNDLPYVWPVRKKK